MNLNLLVTFEAIFIIMLIVITWKQDYYKLFQCSRDRSKIVRDVIYKKFIPIFLRHETRLSYECPFHPDRELLWWPLPIPELKVAEDHQKLEHSFPWICPICGLQFYCSERLIVHWDSEHRHSQQYKEDLVCLADYCSIFRCDVIMKKMLQRKKRFSNYLSITKFQTDDPQLQQQKCDANQMSLLQEMCLNVIQQCTIGIEINISTQTVWTLRKELTESLCSYLTCEHYNDDLFGDDSPSPKVPIILFSTVGFIMLSGFLLFYYLIWNAFKRGWINEQEDRHKHKQITPSKNEDKTNIMMISKKNNQSTAKNTQTHSNHSNLHHSSDKFFENIFEFHREKYEDTFEYGNFDMNQVSKFKSKLHAINSIIEEEEEESEMDINSYPNINRKLNKRNVQKPKLPLFKQHSLTETNFISNKERKKSQEICFQELPMRFHSKYIQPIKQHSLSDQCYPCYTGPMSETFAMLSNKYKSYSHSHLRNPFQHYQHNDKMFNNQTIKQENHSYPLAEQFRTCNEKTYRPTPWSDRYTGQAPLPQRISKSAMSYHLMHPSKRREIYAASKTNSDASIASASSRFTVNSNPSSLKT